MELTLIFRRCQGYLAASTLLATAL